MRGNRTVEMNGVQLWNRTAGSGPALLVQAPGWGVGCAYLEKTLHLLEESFTVVYHDPRGSGRSTRSVGVAEIHVGRMVDDLEALRQHLGIEQFALLGHSHGGYIALNYVLRYPQHLTHLLLVGAMLGADEMEADTERSVRQLAERSQYASAARAWHDGGRVKTDAEFGEWLVRTMPLYFHQPDIGMAVFSRLEQDLPSVLASQGTRPTDRQFAVRDQLHRIQVPTLILAGRHDFRTSLEQETAIHREIPGSRLVVFEESGHFPWFEEPDAFFKAIREFILSTAPKTDHAR